MKMGALVLGYHGCDRDVAENLLAGKSQFKVSKNPYDWLGSGIYFWENNPSRALDWARYMASNPLFQKRVKKPWAVGAIIELGNCLDLTEAVSLQLVKESYKRLSMISELLGTDMPQNKPASDDDEDLVMRHLDCAVINNVHKLRKRASLEAFDTVRGAFHEGKELYPGAAIRTKTHIQLCVCNSASIKGIFRVQDVDKR